MKNKLATLLCILTCMFLTVPALSYAQIPMGGRILMTHECACSGGWMMYILDLYSKSTLPIVFQFGVSRLNSNYNIFSPGVSVLGSYTPGGVCIMASTSCWGGPTPIGTITTYGLPGIGTSTF